jgi:hypothetical protein
MDDVIAEMRRVSGMVAALPPRPKCFMAHHAVPYGQVYRQWNTRGELLVWVNRGEIADLARHKPDYAIAPNAIDTALLTAIPVVNA